MPARASAHETFGWANASTLLIVALITTRKMHITRVYGFAFLTLYVVYFWYLVSRG